MDPRAVKNLATKNASKLGITEVKIPKIVTQSKIPLKTGFLPNRSLNNPVTKTPMIMPKK